MSEFEKSTMPIIKCRGWCGCSFQGLAGDHEIEMCNSCMMEAGERAARKIYAAGDLEKWEPQEEFKHSKQALMPYYLRAKRILGIP